MAPLGAFIIILALIFSYCWAFELTLSHGSLTALSAYVGMMFLPFGGFALIALVQGNTQLGLTVLGISGGTAATVFAGSMLAKWRRWDTFETACMSVFVGLFTFGPAVTIAMQ